MLSGLKEIMNRIAQNHKVYEEYVKCKKVACQIRNNFLTKCCNRSANNCVEGRNSNEGNSKADKTSEQLNIIRILGENLN